MSWSLAAGAARHANGGFKRQQLSVEHENRHTRPRSYDGVVTSFTVELDEMAAERLRRRAQREGVGVAELAGRLLAEASKQDPFEFVASFSSSVLGANDVDGFLDEHGFGSGRS